MTWDKWVSPEVITEIVWALFFHDIQINLGRKNILCIFTNRILLEAMTSGNISLHKKLPCTYVVFLGVCLYVWWDTRKFSLLLLSTPLFCLSQNKYCDSWITHWMPVFILWSWLLNKRSTPVHTFQCLSPTYTFNPDVWGSAGQNISLFIQVFRKEKRIQFTSSSLHQLTWGCVSVL